jgi:cholesterol transport system auxiliary component
MSRIAPFSAKNLNPLYLRARWAVLTLTIALFQACSSAPHAPSLQYDFGPLPLDAKKIQANIAISVADISAPATLDGNAMLYRLQYDNPQLLRPYAQHRWSMPPAQLLTQRLKSSIAAGGGTVTGVADGIAELPVLRIELDEFSHVFSNATASVAQMSLRATVTKKNKLIAQRYFSLATPSASADARGGAKAMQTSADHSIAAILVWLQSVPANK